MAFRFGVVGVSIAVHGVALLALGSIREKKAVEATAISVVDTPKPKEKPPEPAKEAQAPKAPRKAVTRTAAKATPPKPPARKTAPRKRATAPQASARASRSRAA